MLEPERCDPMVSVKFSELLNTAGVIYEFTRGGNLRHG